MRNHLAVPAEIRKHQNAPGAQRAKEFEDQGVERRLEEFFISVRKSFLEALLKSELEFVKH